MPQLPQEMLDLSADDMLVGGTFMAALSDDVLEWEVEVNHDKTSATVSVRWLDIDLGTFKFDPNCSELISKGVVK